MTKQQILNEVANSSWQPQFEFTDDLDTVVDSILKPHEDYFLNLHDKVKEIIEREVEYTKSISCYQITFADVCNWQKELFEHKISKIAHAKKVLHLYSYNQMPNLHKNHQTVIECSNALSLPNQYINLGLRTVNVKVGSWTPPAPMFLEDLKEMCFPIRVENHLLYLPNTSFTGDIYSSKAIDYFSKEDQEKIILIQLTNWYKIFETIHFFEDLNGRVGGIVINILSYVLTGKYLIKK